MSASHRTSLCFAFIIAVLVSFTATAQSEPPIKIFRHQLTGAYGCDNTFRCFSAALAFRHGTLVAHATGPAISIQTRGLRNNWPLQQLIRNTESGGSLNGPVALGDDVLVLTGSSSRYNFKPVLYVYSRTNDAWSLIQTLVPFLPEGFDRTDITSIAIDGNTMFVAGTRYDDSTTTPRIRKRVDVYSRLSSGLFSRLGVIDPPNQQVDGQYTLALDLPYALIGDPAASGARAFLYERVSGRWQLRNTFSPSNDAYDSGYATAVALSGGTALVGAPYRTNPDDETRTGAVYVYRGSSGSSWQLSTIVKGPAAQAGEYPPSMFQFGRSVAIEGGRALIAAGDIELAFLYEPENTGWAPQAKLVGDIQMFPGRLLLSDGTVMLNYYALFGEEAIYVFELPQLGVIAAAPEPLP
jgi:hypothetical protein